jgi:NAD(P)H-hydrate epimerase
MSPTVIIPSTGWRLADAPRPREPIPFVDAATMEGVDQYATGRLGLSLLQMMENAGHALAELGRLMLGGSVNGRRIVVLAGTGNNAGGGLVAARRLAGWGAAVSVAFARPVLRLRPAPCAQLEPLLGAGVRTAVSGHDRTYAEVAGDVAAADLVIDALIGYGLRGAPDTPYRALIETTSLAGGAVVSADIPSGVDASTGERHQSAVAADVTLALALPKTGTDHGEGRRLSGVRYVADIGIPALAFRRAGIELDGLFADGPLLRLD